MDVAIHRYGWVFLVAGSLMNVAFDWRRVRPRIAAHPELANGYRRLIRGMAFWTTLPWLVMGFGCVVGGVPTIFHYLQPIAGGPFVWTFWVVAYAEFLIGGYWALNCGGAESLVRYPGIVSFQTDSIPRMRWYTGSAVVFALLWNTGCLIWLA